MKHLLLFTIIAHFLLVGYASKAQSVAGGELYYIHIGDSTYRAVFKLFQDCSATTTPDSITLCVKNTCLNTAITRRMAKFENGQNGKILSPFCNNAVTTCSDSSSSLSAYKTYFYSDTVTLPSRCSKWVFAVVAGKRTDVYNLQNAASQDLYIEATLNNTATHINSSSRYSDDSYPAIYTEWAHSSRITPHDTDGDSLVSYLIMPQTKGINCTDTPRQLSFTTASPPYTLTHNPYQTNNTFYINPKTADISHATTNMVGKANIAIRTDEYRNKTLIGSTMREMQIQTLPRPVNDTNRIGITYTCIDTPVNDIMRVCANKPVNICYTIWKNNSILYLSNNFSQFVENATISYTNQGTDSVKVQFNWTPTVSDMGKRLVFTQTIVDSACNVFTIPRNNTYALMEIVVAGPVSAGKDITICEGSSVRLSAYGVDSYQWSILPGGTPNSLDNINIEKPVATPLKTTSYVVRYAENPGCTLFIQDTVTVFVKPSTTGADAITNTTGCGLSEPGIDYIHICPEEPFSFCFSSRSSYQDAKLTLSHKTSASSLKITYSNQGNNTVNAAVSWTPEKFETGLHTLTFTSYDSACAFPGSGSRSKETTYNFYVWPPTKANDDVTICRGQSIELKATGGVRYRWEDRSTIPVFSTSYQSRFVVTPRVSGMYIVTSTANTHCPNNTDTVFVTVKSDFDTSTVSISAQPDSFITPGTRIQFTAQATGCDKSRYEWFINGKPEPDFYNNTFSSNKLRIGDKVWCKLYCADSCAIPGETASNTITLHTYNVGVNESGDNQLFSLYPNPNNGTFTIQLQDNKPASIQIVNTLGQVIHSAELNNSGVINLPHISQGIYTIKVSCNGTTHSTRFTKL